MHGLTTSKYIFVMISSVLRVPQEFFFLLFFIAQLSESHLKHSIKTRRKDKNKLWVRLGGVRQARAVVQRIGDAWGPQLQATVVGLPPQEINLISCDPMGHISDIKLIRTDTTLDLSQKAEKGMSCLESLFLFYISAFTPRFSHSSVWDYRNFHCCRAIPNVTFHQYREQKPLSAWSSWHLWLSTTKKQRLKSRFFEHQIFLLTKPAKKFPIGQ